MRSRRRSDWLGIGRRRHHPHDPHRHHGRRRLRGHATTLPPGSVGYEAQLDDKGERLIWLEPRWLDKLSALRGPSESCSDVIVRLGGGRTPSLNGS
jgi:hypothetical protein